ncbi:repressor of RNA polymerase III transcription MAF1 homolog [Watersipora subatra]|uniref:repressor of RNA polymerase III transcription MAF1 homolog n=1 Tax=Watersipora subatra TaxID=2589382 RepID=UPI00355B85AA
MKFLENSSFGVLNCALSSHSDAYNLDGRIESYSCKMTSSDKRLYKAIMTEMDGGSGPNDLHALSPPESVLSRSPSRQVSRNSISSDDGAGFLCDTISTKSLFYLISTLNASFSEYDFSGAKSEEFSKEENLQLVMGSIDSLLAPVIPGYESLKGQLWTAIDGEIGLQECDSIYSYNPDLSSDPFGESGQIWGFNYFFYNRKRKRIVFFNCRCSSSDMQTDEVSADMGYSSLAAEMSIDDMEGAVEEL